MNTAYKDIYIRLSEEFNVEFAFVSIVAREVLYSVPTSSLPFEERLREKIRHALNLIDKSED